MRRHILIDNTIPIIFNYSDYSDSFRLFFQLFSTFFNFFQLFSTFFSTFFNFFQLFLIDFFQLF
jgi:hypothetical protein